MANRKYTTNKSPAPSVGVRRPQGQAYGTNGATDASSVVPVNGTLPRVASSMALNLESSVDDDGVLAHVIAHGAKLPNADTGGTGSQTRPVDAKGYPPAHGMRSRTANREV